MFRRNHHLVFSLVSCCLVSAFNVGHGSLAWADQFVIELSTEPPIVDNSTVRIGDIARVHGGSSNERQRIENFDIDSLQDRDQCTVTKKRISMRLMLEGFRRGTFELVGPESIAVRTKSTSRLRLRLEKLTRDSLARQFGVIVDRINVRMTNAAQIEQLESRLGTHLFSLQVSPLNEFPVGALRLAADLIDSSGQPMRIRLEAHISLLTRVAIAAQPIQRGAIITDQMVRSVEREISTRKDFANPDSLLGKPASRYIPSDSIVLASHIALSSASNQPVVRRNDLIDVVIRYRPQRNSIDQRSRDGIRSNRGHYRDSQPAVESTYQRFDRRSQSGNPFTRDPENPSMKMVSTRCLIATVALTALATTLLGPSAYGQSLFERRSTNQIYQYRDYAARDRGDTLAVLISESTDVENRDERTLDKTGASSSTQGFDFGFGGVIGSATGSASLDTNSANQRGFTGDAEFRSERAINDRFSVTVVDVLPNGNLVIEGTRFVSVQNDVRELRLTGIVRQYDVLPNNTIPSYLVANLRFTLDARGTEQAFTSQGWLSRRFNRFWPF